MLGIAPSKTVTVPCSTSPLTTVARRYNGNGQPTGDPLYSAKLAYSIDATKRRNPR